MSTTDHDKAVSLLQFYMTKAWEAAGLKWQGDNDAECSAVVDLIVSAARAELPALDRQCWLCKGRGVTAARTRCSECGGNGHLITDAGETVIAFLQRHPVAHTRVT